MSVVVGELVDGRGFALEIYDEFDGAPNISLEVHSNAQESWSSLSGMAKQKLEGGK